MDQEVKEEQKQQKTYKKKEVRIVIGASVVLLSLGFFLGRATAINSMQKEFVRVALGGTEDVNNETTLFDKTSDEKNPIVTIDKLPYDITIQKPDGTGKVHLECTYTNNSSYPIKSFELALGLKDKNEKVYLSSSDTVMPGETSLKFNSYGPQTENKDDIEILSYQFIVVKNDGKEMLIKYDAKLDKYKVSTK